MPGEERKEKTYEPHRCPYCTRLLYYLNQGSRTIGYYRFNISTGCYEVIHGGDFVQECPTCGGDVSELFGRQVGYAPKEEANA